MFTGIVETTGQILSSQNVEGGKRLRIKAGALAEGVTLGASVCVNGVCLTATANSREEITFDVIHETLTKTTLGAKQVGDRVNLERSLSVGDRIDGHFVQGHIDGTAVIKKVQSTARDFVLWLRPQDTIAKYMIPKGSVAVDGVSLTIAEMRDSAFSVALIPTTLEHTTLSLLREGDLVNIESDMLARTIVHYLEGIEKNGGLSLQTLRQAGFA